MERGGPAAVRVSVEVAASGRRAAAGDGLTSGDLVDAGTRVALVHATNHHHRVR